MTYLPHTYGSLDPGDTKIRASLNHFWSKSLVVQTTCRVLLCNYKSHSPRISARCPFKFHLACQPDHSNLGVSLLFRYSLTRETKLQVMASISILADHAATITMASSISQQGGSIQAQDSPCATLFQAVTDLSDNLDQDAIQALPLPSDPPTRQDWDAYRTIFTHLYRTENKPLKDIMSITADQYKFKAT